MAADFRSGPVLYVGDINLGAQGAAWVRAAFPQAEVVCWKLGDREGEEALRQRIRSREWSMALSFYSDFIFRPDELQRIALPLNFHPALPSVPGLGYDVLPLLQQHTHAGATLHWMEAAVDTGEIFDVLRWRIPSGIPLQELRRRNQACVIDLLRRWLPRLASVQTPGERLTLLRANPPAERTWGTTRLNRANLQQLAAQI